MTLKFKAGEVITHKASPLIDDYGHMYVVQEVQGGGHQYVLKHPKSQIKIQLDILESYNIDVYYEADEHARLLYGF